MKMEQLSRGNNFFIIDPCYIKEELNISNNFDYSHDELSNSMNDNLNDKITMKSICIKLENIDEEDVHSDLLDNDKNIADVINTKFTNKNMFSEIKINSTEFKEKVSDSRKKLQLDGSEEQSMQNNSTDVIQQEYNMSTYDDSSFIEEDFVLKISDTSDDKLGENEIISKTQNEVLRSDFVPKRKDNENRKLAIVKSKVKENNKLTSRSYETRGNCKLHINDNIASSNLFKSTEILSMESTEKDPRKKYNTADDVINEKTIIKNAEDVLKVSERKIKLGNFILRICLSCKKTSECIGQQIKKCQNCRIRLKFKCLLCDKYCKTKPGIYSHIHNYHSSNSRVLNVNQIEMNKCIVLNCLECNSTCKVRDKKIIMCKNCKVNMVMVCLICSKHYNTASEFYLHIHQEHEPINTKNCLACGVHFQNTKSWINHKKFCGKEPNLSCKYCPHKTKYKWNLQKHIELKHQSNNNFKSKLKTSFPNSGNKKSTDYNDTKQSVKSTRKKLYLQCKYCVYQVKEKHFLKKHVAKVHRAQEKNKNNNIDNIEKEVNNKKSMDVKKKLNFIDLDVEQSMPLSNSDHISTKNNKRSKLRELSNSVELINDDSPFITTPNRLSILNMTKFFCYECDKTIDVGLQKSEKNCEKCGKQLFLKCIKCNRQYEKYQSMIYHLQSKCDPQMYFHCSKCNYKTSVSNLIKKHVVRVHGINYKTNAKKCTKCGNRVKSLIEHSKFCEKDLNTIRNLSSGNSKGRRNFIKTPRIHILTCKNECDKSTSSETMKKCLKCGKVSMKMRSHREFCEKDNMFHCELCTFKTKFNKTDQEVNNKKTLQALCNTTNLSTDNAMESYCSKCDKEYIAKKYVWKCRKCDTKLTFRCVQCNLNYHKLESLRMHVKSHTLKNFNCSNCSKSFAISKNLQMHKNVCIKEPCYR